MIPAKTSGPRFLPMYAQSSNQSFERAVQQQRKARSAPPFYCARRARLARPRAAAQLNRYMP